jgi:multiple antibiotic resistance protein
VKGNKALVQVKTDLDDLASEIALPFMVGAGTISLTLLMAHEFSFLEGIGLLSLVLALNYFMILGLKVVRDNIPRKKIKVAFDKNMEIFLRLTGFFLGAIGINMVIVGVSNLFLA